MSPLETAAERARKVLPAVVSEIVADALLAPVDGRYLPNPSTLQAAEEVMVLPVLAEFYVNGDTGYLWLTHEPCEGSLLEIEAGTDLPEIMHTMSAHRCEENPR